jgi:sulfur-carrier protein adenylyltransferase/sulfurtransferase
MSEGFRLTPDPIESAPSDALDAAGGYVVFEGRVRDRNEGREVQSLEYEAFDEMAIKTGVEILVEARKLFPVLGVRCEHRVGHLQIGDIAIRVEVASAHRKAAFEACDWIVDEVKRRVPIWKKEHYAEGDSGWINCENPRITSEAAYYSRQVTLKEVGEAGQAKLRGARVLVVGAGGLGSPALLYLAAAGVGTLGLVDFDNLDESNLHRQVLFASDEIGRPKAELAASRLRKLNPYVRVVTHGARVVRSNVADLISAYDIVLDCTDNFRTKFLLNDACVDGGKTLIQASIYQYEGQLMVIQAGSPCMRCLWPVAPEEGCVGSCAEVGVLGVVPGVFGAMQATEAIKAILGLPSPLREGKLLLFDLLTYRQQLVGVGRDPLCPACGSGQLPVEPEYEVDLSEIALSDYLVVDVREPDEVESDPISFAVNLPSTRFHASSLPPAGRYLLVCASGVRSGALAKALWADGDRRFYSLLGGARTLRG